MFIIFNKFPSIAFIAGTMAVFKHFDISLPYGIENCRWGFNIRLTDIEVIYFDALSFWLPRQREPVCGWEREAFAYHVVIL